MGWERVSDEGQIPATYIDGRMRLTITYIKTVNIQDYVWNTVNGKPTDPIAERTEFRLWNGAYFIGKFDTREQVAKVVSQLREKEIQKGGRK